ncbi:hypothetical protein [Brevibacterium ihuae]|uniref:hypothetical protein n=1 Tax=Brevibacterium ihuae TaxID=1631743 RepID=UPI000C75D2AE|nr:hypothetical protein [Brevibacterium ihuae]
MDDLLRVGEPLDYAELMDLTLDGLVFRLTDACWVPVGTRVDAELRARALDRPGPRGLVLSHHSAHWVWWGVGTGPTTLEYTTRSRRRVRRADDPWITYERWVTGDDLARVAGIPVTAPNRTLYDLVLLAREDAQDEDAAVARLRRTAAQVSAAERRDFLAYLGLQYRRPHLRAVRRIAARAFGPPGGAGLSRR